jgi:biotin synthase
MNFEPNKVQISTLCSIKTGSCPEDCGYCAQSAHYKTSVSKTPLMSKSEVLEAAKQAKAAGSTRFCMAAGWRGPHERDISNLCDMIAEVKKLGIETCASLGLLKDGQAQKLQEAGLDFYNHNIDTSEEYYSKVITTRTFQDRLDTLAKVREVGIKVCCGGILGLGESNQDRINMLLTLANLEKQPESVPFNKLIKIPGTPMKEAQEIDSFEFIRTIALARIMMPRTYIRISAGRTEMSEEMQAFCFLVGANSIHYGEKLLTTDNPIPQQDQILFRKLGLSQLNT